MPTPIFSRLTAPQGAIPGAYQIHAGGQPLCTSVKDGNMVLGHAQDIYFAEFDGIKNRKYYIQVMGE